MVKPALAATKITRASTALLTIVAWTSFLYLIQFISASFAILSVGSLIMFEATGISYIDFGLLTNGGEGVFFTSTGVVLAVGAFSLLIAIGVFMLRGVKINKELSLLVAALCFCLYVLPGFNLVPWAWMWSLYVVKSQTAN